MMAQVVGAIELQARSNWRATQPVANPIIERRVFEEQPMRSIVHQDGQTQLPIADHKQCQQKADRMRPLDAQRHGTADQCPGMQHQVGAHGIGALAQHAHVLCAQRGRLRLGGVLSGLLKGGRHHEKGT